LQITAHIIPRRVVLWSIAALALALRLWGLSWGPVEAGVLHPAEWTWQVIKSLSLENPTYPGIWTQAFFSLAACVHGLLSLLAGWWEVLLGQARTLAEVEVSARLAGRLTVALLGSAQVLITYMVGRRFFDSVATGLVAAGLVAVSPLLVTHSHYLSLDVPLGFMLLACLWACWTMLEYPRARVMAVAGMILGLTITTRASGVMIILVMAAAYVLGVRQARPKNNRIFLFWPAAFVLGTVLGLLVGYPGFLLRSDQTADLVMSSMVLPPHSGGAWLGFALARLSDAGAVVFNTVGPQLLALWAVGVGLQIFRRRWGSMLLAGIPILFFLASVTLLRGSLEGLTAAWLPAMALLAAWPLVWLCRKLPAYRWAVLGVSVLGVTLCLWPLWRSLGADYLFWQQDTLSSARFWVEANLPPQADIHVGPRTPLNVYLTTRALSPTAKPEDMKAVRDFVVTSSLGEEDLADPWRDWTQPKAASQISALTSRLQLLHRFDLKEGWGAAPYAGRAGFPRWVSPRVEVFAAVPPLKVRQPLALWKPPVGVERGYAVVYTDNSAYSRDEGTMLVGQNSLGQRVLAADKGLGDLGLVLANLGEDLAVIEVAQGLWPSHILSLYPGQETDLRFPARGWPPMNRMAFPVRVRLRQGGRLLARVQWDPMLVARRALQSGRYRIAAEILQDQLKQGGEGFDARAMLAQALVRLGKVGQAAEVLQGLNGLPDDPASAYEDLALAELVDDKWRLRFRELTGYHPRLLSRACSLDFFVDGPPLGVDGKERPVSGRGFHGTYRRNQVEGRLRLWMETPLPRAGLRAELEFSLPEPGTANRHLSTVEVWVHGPRGAKLLGSRRIASGDLSGGKGVVFIPLQVPWEGSRLELRVDYATAMPLRLERFKVGVDLQSHMRHVLRWYLDAKGRVALDAKRYQQAVEYFEKLLKLDPGFSRAYIPSARALSDMGKMDQARERARAAEVLFTNQPERLETVLQLYKNLQQPEDSARVEARLAHLRPSLKREARFAGGLTLLGYDISANQVERGGTLDVSYYWRCWARPPLNYFIFVHLRGPDRTLTYDHLLDHGRQNMANLNIGEVVREDYKMKVPADIAPGRYRLVVGLWDPQHTGKGVPILAGEGKGSEEVELATVEVK
jgi:tetratricopeptide (TPR) repeat protein/4-amino-4-deoxy-L-arabinose transferase-like glycosyltransferase